MYIFLSPHYDDVIGATGGTISRLTNSGETCCILTVMAKVPWNKPLRIKYVIQRCFENYLASKVLKCKVKNAPFLDAIYRNAIYSKIKKSGLDYLFDCTITEHELVESIRKYILSNTEPSDIIIAPAGLGNHLDHLIVNKAVSSINRTLYYYEEFYYDQITCSPMVTDNFKCVNLSTFELNKKLEAMLKYRKTLKGLWGKNWKDKMINYYNKKRNQNSPYEKFNDVDFLK